LVDPFPNNWDFDEGRSNMNLFKTEKASCRDILRQIILLGRNMVLVTKSLSSIERNKLLGERDAMILVVERIMHWGKFVGRQ
jgi:hypothetical protein